ncbi:MAG TPA: hypothetical protein VIK84_05550 [Haloplasmataceae bacterium]
MKKELTPFKLISGIIAGILIIVICLFLIIQKIGKHDNTYWQEIILIGLAIFFLAIVIKGAIFNKVSKK